MHFLNDSGWYQMDLGKAENWFWGKGEGCDFLDGCSNHTNFPEFCPVSNSNIVHTDCSRDYLARGYCFAGFLADGCALNLYVDYGVCNEQIH